MRDRRGGVRKCTSRSLVVAQVDEVLPEVFLGICGQSQVAALQLDLDGVDRGVLRVDELVPFSQLGMSRVGGQDIPMAMRREADIREVVNFRADVISRAPRDALPFLRAPPARYAPTSQSFIVPNAGRRCFLATAGYTRSRRHLAEDPSAEAGNAAICPIATVRGGGAALIRVGTRRRGRWRWLSRRGRGRWRRASA